MRGGFERDAAFPGGGACGGQAKNRPAASGGPLWSIDQGGGVWAAQSSRQVVARSSGIRRRSGAVRGRKNTIVVGGRCQRVSILGHSDFVTVTVLTIGSRVGAGVAIDTGRGGAPGAGDGIVADQERGLLAGCRVRVGRAADVVEVAGVERIRCPDKRRRLPGWAAALPLSLTYCWPASP